jgi:hypothetical protein
MKRLAIAAVGLALVVGIVVGGMVGNPFGASAQPAAPNPGHIWTELENHGTSGAPVDTYWLGTTADQALELRVNGRRALRLEPNAITGYPNVIGGHDSNSVTGAVYGGATSGGGSENTASDSWTTISGGWHNTASGGIVATVAGGYHNEASGQAATVSGGTSNIADGEDTTVGGGTGNTAGVMRDTVAGGYLNTASGGGATVGGGEYNVAPGDRATAGGGYRNEASGGRATVSGGDTNTASGDRATVPGGRYNTAAGVLSFAAGLRAKANNQGCFVWGDSTDADVACNDNNRFIARASGGVYLYSSSDLSTGSYLAAGSGSWSSVSDRALKDNFTPVDGQEVLASLAEIPITTWNYQAQDASIRHMGPTAQDFRNAFGLGESDTAISTVDADGVALAAIQGLDELLQEKDAQIADLEARVGALEEGTGVKAAVSQASSSDLPRAWLVLGGGLTLALGGLVLVQRRLAGGRR